MKGKHSPGPWVTANPRAGFWQVFQDGEPDKGAIAVLDHSNDGHPGFKYVTVPANAKLMAAAPDLLEACQNLENDNGAIPKHAWDLIQKAIKKATE